MKKSQITIFVVLGIVIFIVLGIVYFVSNLDVSEKLEGEAEKFSSDIASNAQVNRYVNSCIKGALQEGVETIEKQGGFIFQGQEGSILRWSIETYYFNNTRVAYQILEPPNNYIDLVPGYPCFLLQKNNPAYDSENYCGYPNEQIYYYYGRRGNTLPNLCKNKTYGYLCSGGINNRFSIQEQLEAYIEDGVEKCVKPDELKNLLGYESSYENITAEVSITENSVKATITMPLTIILSNGKPVLVSARFSEQMSSKLKELYRLSELSISKDLSNITFDLSQPQSYFTWPEGFNISVFSNSSTGNSIAYINYVSGEKFQFSRKNRAPALNYIPEINVSVGETLEIIPSAHDPDEGDINYYYTSNWKNQEFLHGTELYRSGDPSRGLEKERGIGFTVEESDVGAHNITVYASDGIFTDYQTVKIKVQSGGQCDYSEFVSYDVPVFFEDFNGVGVSGISFSPIGKHIELSGSSLILAKDNATEIQLTEDINGKLLEVTYSYTNFPNDIARIKINDDVLFQEPTTHTSSAQTNPITIRILTQGSKFCAEGNFEIPTGGSAVFRKNGTLSSEAPYIFSLKQNSSGSFISAIEVQQVAVYGR